MAYFYDDFIGKLITIVFFSFALNKNMWDHLFYEIEFVITPKIFIRIKVDEN